MNHSSSFSVFIETSIHARVTRIEYESALEVSDARTCQAHRTGKGHWRKEKVGRDLGVEVLSWSPDSALTPYCPG